MKKLPLLAMLVAISSGIYAQSSGDFTKPMEVIPPSPVSYQMSKYGGVNVTTLSGSPNISIPLLTYAVKSLTVPIGLKYTSNGIKVDEVAGRAGTGFNTEMGGVITRVVYDVPDEVGSALTVPSNLSAPSPTLWSFYDAASNSGNSYDTQPDVYNFSFAGYSGKFIISGGIVKQLIKSDLKIVPNIEGYGFRITTPEGNKYYFGGAGGTETSQSETACDKTGGTPITGWQLMKIIAYTGEVINFTYQSKHCKYPVGANETVTQLRADMSETCVSNAGLFPASYLEKFCAMYLDTDYKLLTEISSSLNGRVKFSYITRTDLPGEYLLSKIRHFASADSSVLKSIVNLNYVYGNSGGSYLNSFNTAAELRYRPFLNTVEERSSDNILIRKHSFTYNDINGMPTRLSFSQDLYGYFNGKNNTNHIAPKHELQPYLADRSPDWDYAKKGLLTKVVYPTGGSDSIVYEPNTLYQTITLPNTANESVYGSGIDFGTAQSHTSVAVTPSAAVTATLSVVCDYTGNFDDYRIAYHYVKAEVIDQTTSTVVYTKNRTNYSETVSVSLNLTASHSYVLKVTAYGADVLGSMNISYDSPVTVTQNMNAAGLRVQRTLTKSSATDPVQVRRYYYGTPESGYLNSSGAVTGTPVHHMLVKRIMACSSGYQGRATAYYDTFYSNAINTQYLQQTPVQYETVAEALGDDFENGGTVYKFMLRYDNPPNNLFGAGLPGAPLSNYGGMNGLLVKKTDLMKKGGVLKTARVVDTHYSESNCHDFSSSCTPVPVYGYVVRRNFADINPLNAYDTEPFDAAMYEIRGYWFYPDTVKTTSYDTDGNNPVVETEISLYANNTYTQPTEIKKITSTGVMSTVEHYYPYNSGSISGLTSPQITALTTLTTQNRISVPVMIVEKFSGTETKRIRIDYKDWGAGLVLPEYYKTSKSSSALKNKVVFYQYDVSGNLLSQSQADGPRTSYVWSYGGMYPVAEVKNTTYAAVETALGSVNISTYRTLLNPSIAALNTFLSPLRSPGIANSLVTTFTYPLLTGIATVTDARGVISSFEYDTFQRLQHMKDLNGDIVKSYEYHFKP